VSGVSWDEVTSKTYLTALEQDQIVVRKLEFIAHNYYQIFRHIMKQEIKEKFINRMIEDYQDICGSEQNQKVNESSSSTVSEVKSETDVFKRMKA